MYIILYVNSANGFFPLLVYFIVSSGFQCVGGNDTTLHPDTTNCYYFYQCIGFTAYRMPCPTGLQFNVANGTCDYPENSKCVYGGSPATLVPPIGIFSVMTILMLVLNLPCNYYIKWLQLLIFLPDV